MYGAWSEVERLVSVNAQHRKGFRLGEMTLDGIVEHARDELAELARDPGSVDEMADVLGCLIHYCVRQGWSMGEVERAMLQKLSVRFTER